jgi:hypothetical protein
MPVLQSRSLLKVKTPVLPKKENKNKKPQRDLLVLNKKLQENKNYYRKKSHFTKISGFVQNSIIITNADMLYNRVQKLSSKSRHN